MLTEEVLRLAEEYPEAIGSCSYVRGSAGSGVGCIFGQALKNIGVSESFLEEFDTEAAIGISTLSRRLGLEYDPRWSEVQDLQDSEVPWGVAVKDLR